MKREAALLAFLISCLFVAVPGVSAYGSYYQNQFNDSTTVKNLTLNVTPYSEIVWVSIPRRVNITGGYWNFAGRGVSGTTLDNATRYSCAGTFELGDGFPCSNAVDKLWSTWMQGNNDASYDTHVQIYLNYSMTPNMSANITAYFQRNNDGADCEIYYYNYSKNGLALLNRSDICGSFSAQNYNVSASIPSDGTNTSILRLMVNITSHGTVTVHATRFRQLNVSFDDRMPENVTIDIASDGTKEYINNTVWNVTAPVNLNSSALAAINSYIQNTCTADFPTGSCPVPLNISSATAGILGLSALNFSGAYYSGQFNVTIRNEKNNNLYHVYNGTLSIYCSDVTYNYSFSGSGLNDITYPCSTSDGEIRLLVNDYGNPIIRYLSPSASTYYNLTFYVYNGSTETDIAQVWSISDQTGDYSNGILSMYKILSGGVGQKTMQEKRIDAEGKVTNYMIVGDRYCFSIFDTDKGNEKALGCMDADTDTAKTMEISAVPFNPANQYHLFNRVAIYFAWDKDDKTVTAVYNDSLDETTWVNITLYNASRPQQSLHSYLSTSPAGGYISVTFNSVAVNETYIAIVTAEHLRFGTITQTNIIDFGGKYIISALSGLGLGVYMSMAAGIISLFVMLAFGRKHVAIGIFAGFIIIALFMLWGWFDSTPQLGWGFLTLMVFVAVINAMGRRKQ